MANSVLLKTLKKDFIHLKVYGSVDLETEKNNLNILYVCYSMLRQCFGGIPQGTVNKVYLLVNTIYGFSKSDSMWSI